jgi:hypothetical protein
MQSSGGGSWRSLLGWETRKYHWTWWRARGRGCFVDQKDELDLALCARGAAAAWKCSIRGRSLKRAAHWMGGNSRIG